jgi:hypothetical protein
MKGWFAAFILILMVSMGAAAKGPEVNLVDDRISINAENIPLSRLLQLVDMATGMKSKIPAELGSRNVSVKLSDLNLTEAVRKIFQGQPLDYVMIEGQGIVVMRASQTGPTSSASSAPPPAYNPGLAQQPQPNEQPFSQDFAAPVPGQIPPIGQQGQQPGTVQTPFGPMANPRTNQPQQQPTAAVPNPQQNSLFPQPGQSIGQPIGQPVGQQPTIQPNMPQQNVPYGNQTPFGTASPFGAANPQNANPNNGLFGTPQVFGTPSTPQR